MVHCGRVLFRKICCLIVVALLVSVLPLEARGRTTTIIINAGSARATVDGRAVTMLVPSVVDQTLQRTLVPIGFIARYVGFTVTSEASGSLKLSTGTSTVVVTPGKQDALVNGTAVHLGMEMRGLLGEVLVAVDDIHSLLPVEVHTGSTGHEFVFPRTVDTPVVSGSVDSEAVTLGVKHEQVFKQTVDFYIVRIDMTGKGIRVLSCQSVGGVGTARYPSAYVGSLKPLALMNATPFNMTSYIMSGSVQNQGIPVYYSGTYIATIGIDPDNTPFYAEGTARAVIRLGGGQEIPALRINQSAAGATAQGCSLYSNYYSGGIFVASSELLLVIQGSSIVRTLSGSSFVPSSMQSGQLAVYIRRPDLVTSARAAASVEMRTFVGSRDCTGATFLQCGPVVVRDSKPYLDYRKYKDIGRATKLGSRAFIGMDDQKHLFFIATPARVRLQFGDVSLALSRLGLFTNVVTLDGGTSTTLYYKGQYIIKGSRAITNVLCVPAQ